MRLKIRVDAFITKLGIWAHRNPETTQGTERATFPAKFVDDGKPTFDAPWALYCTHGSWYCYHLHLALLQFRVLYFQTDGRKLHRFIICKTFRHAVNLHPCNWIEATLVFPLH